MADDDPLFGYASCPRCGSGNLSRVETPVKSTPLDEGGTLRQWSNVVLCHGCGDTVYEKKFAHRVEPPAPARPAEAKRDDKREEPAAPATADRLSLLDVD